MTEERKDSLPDEEFAAYLEGRSKVSEVYRPLREVEPPPELDRAVLREAQAAVEQPERPHAFLSGWLPRFAVAATLLVAVGVALRFDSAPIETLPLEEPAMRDAPAARAVTRESPPDVLVQPRFEAPSTRPRTQPLEIERSEAVPEDAAAPAGFDEQAAAAMPEGRGSARENAAEPDAGAQGQETARGGQSFESEARRLADADQSVDFYVDAPRAFARRDLASDRTRLDGLEAALRSRLGGGRDLSDEAVLADVNRRLLRVNAHFYRRSGEALPVHPLETGPSEPLPREDWLALIDALIDVGDIDAAQSEVVRFIEAWPDYLLAPRHQALLSEE